MRLCVRDSEALGARVCPHAFESACVYRAHGPVMTGEQTSFLGEPGLFEVVAQCTSHAISPDMRELVHDLLAKCKQVR